ncbi:MAG: hypothetical protein KAR20_19515, partial [Candidatus Heimdallarchaeota archaeon]|nr:hypothetical protein [Candidatus Heimdallarchaeota archaeon]
MNSTKLTDKNRKSKNALRSQSLIERLNLKELEQSRFVLILVAAAFILHWFTNVVASLMFMHFQSGSGELGLLVSLLIISLFTFIIALVSFIELLKFTRAACSIAIVLVWVNLLINILLLIHSSYWLGVCIHLVFAIAVTLMLTGKKSVIRLILGILLLVVNFTLVLYPAAKYMETRNYVEKNMAVLDEIDQNSTSKVENIELILSNSELLCKMAPYVGEKQMNIAFFISYFGLSKAFNNDMVSGYRLSRDSVRKIYSKTCYVNKTKVYALQNGVAFEKYVPKILSKSENEMYEKKMSMLKYSEEFGSKDDDSDLNLPGIDDDDEDDD